MKTVHIQDKTRDAFIELAMDLSPVVASSRWRKLAAPTGLGVLTDSFERWKVTLCRLFVGCLLIALAASCVGCNEELGPIDAPSGFSGLISFRNWPPATDIKEMRLVAFDQIPTDSASIIPMLLAGKAAVFPPLPGDYFQTLVDSIPYVFTDKSGTNLQVKEYAYVAVMYQYGPNILRDWRPAGVYSKGPGMFEPASVRVILHHVLPDINIRVDFNNLPPPPWR